MFHLVWLSLYNINICKCEKYAKKEKEKKKEITFSHHCIVFSFLCCSTTFPFPLPLAACCPYKCLSKQLLQGVTLLQPITVQVVKTVPMFPKICPSDNKDGDVLFLLSIKTEIFKGFHKLFWKRKLSKKNLRKLWIFMLQYAHLWLNHAEACHILTIWGTILHLVTYTIK